MYRAETDVLVEPIDFTPATPVGAKAANMDTEQRLAKSSGVALSAATELKWSGPLPSLQHHVVIGGTTNTDVLQFKYSDPDPHRAQAGAQAFASAYLNLRSQAALKQLEAQTKPYEVQIDALRQQLRQVTAQIARTPATSLSERQSLQTQANSLILQANGVQQRLNDLAEPSALEVGRIVAPAELPTMPFSPNYPKTVGLGIVIGLAFGLVVAHIRERLDEQLRGLDDLEAWSGAPALGVVPRVQGWDDASKNVLVSLTEPISPAAEAYRALRARLSAAISVVGAKTLLVTSGHPGEGKSTTVANLGVALARAGTRVVLVSADRRRPRLNRFFGAPEEPGLTEYLAGELKLTWAVIDVGVDNLRLLPSGRAEAPQDQFGDADAIGRLLKELAQHADVVLIDATPLFGLADALSLAPLVDAVLLVADARLSTRRDIGRARQQFEQLGTSLIGTVLNNVTRGDASGYDYGYGGYGYGYGYGYGDGDTVPAPRKRQVQQDSAHESEVKQSSHP